MQTGENEQALRKILDMTRLISIALLVIHFYYYGYTLFAELGFTSKFSDRILKNIYRTSLFSYFHKSKLLVLLLVIISLLGAKGRKDEKLKLKTALYFILAGLFLYFGSFFILWMKSKNLAVFVLYIFVTSLGYLLVISGGTLLSRIITRTLNGKDIFNKENETFPQEERLLQNEYSINLPAEYHLRDKVRKSWINIINPFRGLLVCGSPGSGKSYFVIRHIITQHISKGFTMFVYDFKFDDLTKITYNAYLKFRHLYAVQPKFFVINFDDLNRCHRCNPLEPSSMTGITDAAESARTILLGLNREWIKKQGDFFVESPINFLTAVIWYLKKHNNGEFCTLPHVIELMQLEYHNLFSLLRSEKEIEVLINPFVSAFQNEASEQLEGQIASAKIAMSRLSSPQLYYVLCGNDFSLDINNPLEPKIICMGNNPQKIQTYGAVLSLFINRLIKQVNQKDKLKSSLIFDEFPTVYLNNIDSLIATARSNKVATCLGIQDLSQLKKDYGREQADVVMNITGNIISGQVSGDTAKQLSERFGKIMQDRESLSINNSDTSISRSRQLESAVPASKISSLSSGEFVGMTADNPDCRIDLKTFHAQIINDHKSLQKETENYIDFPPVRTLNNTIVNRVYDQIKMDIQELVESEINAISEDHSRLHLLLKKKKT
ncbi:Type IV secretory system Conjugative DNA transfer [Flavobacterium aquidurense]|uniref:Conjugal transfer protein TraG n=1 Tax=Flavobacterium frigidimaris TaxID=262320 RepID=A0ABX4BPD5_FLAFR|nr:conjugal transfer protein MobC [Flavobacterium frigidimaris]OXA78651.1 conjugal transfer protein TraG [Flavobacterium frigidimaris]SDZ58008.1 Type IV secretory system Conjugative DNA transfer [Flavobacterium aquidurense]